MEPNRVKPYLKLVRVLCKQVEESFLSLSNMPSPLSLPREGITLEFLLRPVRLALQPVVTVPILIALIQYPDSIRSRLPAGLTVDTLVKWTGVVCVLGIVRKINAWLTDMTVNNWTSDTSWDWSKEVVLITGGCDGIGELVVRNLAGLGIRVAVIDVKEPGQSFPSNVSLYKADVTSIQSIKEVATRIRAEVGEPSVLVNNVGIALGHSILDETPEQTQKLMDINVVSQFTLLREFLPSMIRANHGHILTVASLASFFTHSHNVSYAASKAAVLAVHEGLTQELRHDYRADKVRTSVVHPLWVSTTLLAAFENRKQFKALKLNPGTVSDAIVRQILSGRGAQVILPHRYSPVVGSLRALPNWLQDTVRNTQALLLHD